ncbi:unnamed protein product [Onchocerca flexuosa]|uniref:Uncharacterized protein n=1 Tax=Onchocerca flexuosa TaxID=387005 RepID=A0A183HRF5_9BILA|nr:unnamed protein product [Onchocerca flexuosa]
MDFKTMNMDREIIRNRTTPSYLKSNIRRWLRDGNIGKLEQLVLSGCGDLLSGHTVNNSDSKNFLGYLNNYLVIIASYQYIYYG